MGKRIVIALGGNALGKNLEEQMHAVKTTASAIADLIEDGHEVVIAHGNGPQVGMIQNAFAAYHKQQAKSDIMPLSMCVAMSQGYIGYDLQNMIGEELDRRGLGIHCATVLTQVAVDPADPAFQHPTKPIGAFMTEEEAKKLAAEKGIDVAEDAGRGWRQVVASPRPKEIVEIATVKALMNAKHAVIAAGGGGIPVVWEDKYHLKGVPAVIDKDFASECMAEQLDADMLIILTAVEKVAIKFRQARPEEPGRADPGRGPQVHGRGPVRARLHAAEGRGRCEVRRVQARPHLPHHPAGEGQGRHRGQDRHCHPPVRSLKTKERRSCGAPFSCLHGRSVKSLQPGNKFFARLHFSVVFRCDTMYSEFYAVIPTLQIKEDHYGITCSRRFDGGAARRRLQRR